MAKHRTTIIDELTLLDEACGTQPAAKKPRRAKKVVAESDMKVCRNEETEDEDSMIRDEETEYTDEDETETSRNEGLSDEVDLEDELEEAKDAKEEPEADSMDSFKEKLDDILQSIKDLKDSMEADPEATEESEVENDVDSSNGEEEGTYNKEDFTPLFDTETTLSEEFKSKANVVFNAVLQTKLEEATEKLAAKAEKVSNRKMKGLLETAVEDVNDYFEYITEQWMNENQLAVEQGIRNNLVENVLYKFKKALAESYIELPEEDLMIMEELEHKSTELKTKLDSVLSENIKLKKSLMESKKNEVQAAICEGLTDLEVDRFKNLAKNVDFDSSKQYKDELVALKEAVIKKAPKVESKTKETVISEAVRDVNYDIATLNPTKRFVDIDVQRVEHSKISEYTQHLGRLVK
jgi:hypothetical protein